jgi:hypothetical protein
LLSLGVLLLLWRKSLQKQSPPLPSDPEVTREEFEELKSWVTKERRRLEEEWTETWNKLTHLHNRENMRARRGRPGEEPPAAPLSDEEVRAGIMRDAVRQGIVHGVKRVDPA